MRFKAALFTVVRNLLPLMGWNGHWMSPDVLNWEQMQLPQAPISWRQHWGKRSQSDVWERQGSVFQVGEHQPGCEIMYMGTVVVSTILTSGIMGYVHLNYRRSGRAQKRLWNEDCVDLYGLPGASNKRPRDLGDAKHWMPEEQAVRIKVTLIKILILKRNAHKGRGPPPQHSYSSTVKKLNEYNLPLVTGLEKKVVNPFLSTLQLMKWGGKLEKGCSSWASVILLMESIAKSCKLHNREESVPKCKFTSSLPSWVTHHNCRHKQPFISQISIQISSQTSPVAIQLVHSDKAEMAQQAGCSHKSAHRASLTVLVPQQNSSWWKSHRIIE